ncbi:MAG TPA: histidine kinase dimerization/phospho-acceptor domain-containing protein [Patescibacteria group bacterium]
MTLTYVFAAAFLLTLVLLIRSLFRQAGIQDAIKQTAEEAADQLRLWEEFGEHLDEGLALVGPDGTIRYVNRAFSELTGWKGRSAKGQKLKAVLAVLDGDKPFAPDEKKRKGIVRSRDDARTAVYVTKRKLHQPQGFEVVVLVDATAEDAEKALRRRLVNLSSFELRAPITAMKGYADMLLSGDAGKLDKEAKTKVKIILESSDKLLRIIDDMSQVQALSEAKPAAARKRTKATALAEACTGSLQRVTAESGRSYELEPIKSDSEVEVAPADVERLLGMVANTAARTGKPGSVVTMRLVENDAEIDFRIENEGAPLARDQQKNVFDYVGAQGFDEGIGYYVAQQIISAHGGRFSVSQIPAGNAFTLSLPRAKETVAKKRPKKLDISE